MLADLYEAIDMKIRKERKKLPWSSTSEFRDELNKARQANFSIYKNPFEHYNNMPELVPLRHRIPPSSSRLETEKMHLDDINAFHDAEQDILSNPPDTTLHDIGNRQHDFNETLQLMQSKAHERSIEAGLLTGFTHVQLVKSLKNYYKSIMETPPLIDGKELSKANKTALVELAVETNELNVSDMQHHRDNNPPPTPP